MMMVGAVSVRQHEEAKPSHRQGVLVQRAKVFSRDTIYRCILQWGTAVCGLNH